VNPRRVRNGRTFLKTAATLTLIMRSERIFGANDRVRIGVCGLRGRGKDHIDAFVYADR